MSLITWIWVVYCLFLLFFNVLFLHCYSQKKTFGIDFWSANVPAWASTPAEKGGRGREERQTERLVTDKNK